MSAPVRPCLPSVEKLDPRTLLSVSVTDFTIVKHVDKSTPTLLVAESDVFTPVPGANVDSNYKGQFVEMGNDFLKINDILLKYEQDILDQKVSPTEGTDVTESLSLNFTKIETIAAKLDGGNGELLPAVHKVFELVAGTGEAAGNDGTSILGDLSNLAAQLKITPFPDAEAGALYKMAGDFYKLGEVALNYKLDLIQGVPMDVAQKQATSDVPKESLSLNFTQVVLSDYISQGDQTDLSNIIDGAVNLVNGVINPVTPQAVIGPTVPGGTGDTIV